MAANTTSTLLLAAVALLFISGAAGAVVLPPPEVAAVAVDDQQKVLVQFCSFGPLERGSPCEPKRCEPVKVYKQGECAVLAGRQAGGGQSVSFECLAGGKVKYTYFEGATCEKSRSDGTSTYPNDSCQPGYLEVYTKVRCN